MKEVRTFLTLGFLTILLCAVLDIRAAMADTLLDVPLVIQEHSNWCWAGADKTTLSYYGVSVSQCDIADYSLGYGSQYCCGNSTFDWNHICNSGQSISDSSSNIVHWGVNAQQDGTALSQSESVAEINCQQPFVIGIAWTSGGGHEVVGYGYDQNGQYLDYMDPWPGKGYTKALYSWIDSASDHYWYATIRTTLMDRPSDVSAVAGNAQATVSFSAPVSHGSSPIAYYTVESNLGHTATGTTSPITVSGLTNGTSYQFTATATNSADCTTFSSYGSNWVTPYTLPGAPTGVLATAGPAQATVSFTAAPSNGSPITSYMAKSNPGNIMRSGSTSPITVTGLANGTAYTFTVTATNAAGTGPPSSPSNGITTPTAPGAPTIVLATAGIGQASVSFTVPASDGGSPITSYRATSNPGSITGSGSASPITVTGLTGGAAYTFTVTATNAVGTGQASSPSNSVTPTSTAPGAPTGVSATAGPAQATVSFTAAPSNGSPITSYTAKSNPGNITRSGSASPITVMGLANGTTYTFTVTATNGVGTGPASSPSNSVTPTVPAAVSVPALSTPVFLFLAVSLSGILWRGRKERIKQVQ